MIELPLTKGYVAVVDDEDAHLARFKWTAKVRPHTVYAMRKVNLGHGKRGTVYLHRVVLGVAAGVSVDHVDMDGLNCRRSNLRVASPGQNKQNRPCQANSASRLKGVSRHRASGLWAAEIDADGKRYRLGYFATPEEAARAYDAAAREKHGAFARLNFPDPAP